MSIHRDDAFDTSNCRARLLTQHGPVISENGRDRLVVAWLGEPLGPSDSEITIFYRVVHLGNPAWSTPARRLSLPTTGSKNDGFVTHNVHPSIAMTSDDELGSAFVAVWEERFLYREQPLAQYSLRRMRVMARRFDGEGMPLGVPIVIEERSGFEFGDTQANPVVAMDPHGNFIVVWEPITPYGDGTRLTGRLYDWASNVIAPRIQVDYPVLPLGCSIAGRANPSISVSSDARFFAVSWTARACSALQHRDGLRVFRFDPVAALPVVGSNVVEFLQFQIYHATSVFLDTDSLDPNSAVGIVLGLESVPGDIKVNRFRVDFAETYPASIDLCGWGVISLLGDGCRRFEFPSIATWPSVISFGTEADWCERAGIPLHNCVSPVAWTAPRYSCEDEECPSADDRDVLTAPSAEAEPDDCSCGTSDVTVNAFDLDNSSTDEQATGPPHLTYFDQADRGDRRQVASLSHVWLADVNTHAAVNAYVWQGVGLIDPTQGTTEENLDPLGVYLTLAADAGTDLPDINANILPEPSADCNGNGTADEIELLCFVLDRNGNDVLDECEIDCDTNETPDVCDIARGSADCNGDGWPDACDSDCNTNGAADDCDIDQDTSLDCDLNGYPDECDLAPGGCGVDCNTNGTL
ncbi:MAG: hypothetical protein HUU22_09680, partial [Phycisphaerae bacterium]|nr:hypothetical protein [Phycisphaerae bacterium]